MPIVARGCGLGFAVLVAGGVGKGRVVRTKADTRPILCCSGVIHVGKARATMECTIANARHAIADRNARKARAIMECIIFNARHAVGDHNARKARATMECPIANARHAVGDHNACQARTT